MGADTYIRFRCSEDLKVLVEQQAAKDGRSVSNYIKRILSEEIKKTTIDEGDIVGKEDLK